MSTPLSDVAAGFAALGSLVAGAMDRDASRPATNIDDGKYDADSAADDLAETASLAARTGW